MQDIIHWFRRRPITGRIVLVIYFLAVVLPHKRFGWFLNNYVFQGITRAQYNGIVLVIGLVLLAIVGFVFMKGVRKQPDKRLLIFYMILNTMLAALVFRYLFVINIEIIHFPQYAIMAVIVFTITGNYNASLLWATFLGAIDESYQYFYLAPTDTFYFDFNDVITNLIGAVFGLLILRSQGYTNTTIFQFFRSRFFYTVLFTIAVLGGLHLCGILSVYPSDHHTFQLLKSWPKGFWTSINLGVTYHITLPGEGLLITSVLLFVYHKIGLETDVAEKR